MSKKCALCGHRFKKDEDKIQFIGYSDVDDFCRTCVDERDDEIMAKIEKELGYEYKI